MKRFFNLLSLFSIIIIVCFGACDYVSNPYQEATPQTTTTTTGGTAPVTRKMLAEDYTGHKCDNCPRAGRTLHQLKEDTYHDELIIVSIHAGSFANTTPLPSGEQFPTDMTTSVGTTYYTNTDLNVIAMPFFMFNRKDVMAGNNYVSESALPSAAAASYNLPPDFKLEITDAYSSGTRNLSTRVKVTALNAMTSKYNVVILLTEDSVVAEQLDKYVTPNYVPNYLHRDVLRGAINSAWGTQVFTTGTISAGDTTSVSFPSFNVNSAFNDNHCHIVAFIYDADQTSTRYYEILQAEEVSIK
jgi:hypothetical protein